MVTKAQLKKLAKEYGTPLFVVDHDQLRKNLAEFKKYLPKVQPYFAVKSNSLPEIVRTLYKAGASFDVASIAEFRTVYENIKELPPRTRAPQPPTKPRASKRRAPRRPHKVLPAGAKGKPEAKNAPAAAPDDGDDDENNN